MIEGSAMVRLFERRDPEAVTARRNAGDGLPDRGGVRRRHRPRHPRARHRTGDTVYVGGPDYLS